MGTSVLMLTSASANNSNFSQVNNCVGLGNHKFFMLFLLYICTGSLYALCLIMGRMMTCTIDTCQPTAMQGLAIVGVVIEACLFGLFTCCMGCDQWQTVTSNRTGVFVFG